MIFNPIVSGGGTGALEFANGSFVAGDMLSPEMNVAYLRGNYAEYEQHASSFSIEVLKNSLLALQCAGSFSVSGDIEPANNNPSSTQFGGFNAYYVFGDFTVSF